MVAHCPPFLLREEVERLQPAALVAFGLDVFQALEALGAIADGNDYLAWGELEVAQERCAVLWLYHPAGRHWLKSHQTLKTHLESTSAPDWLPDLS